MAYGYKKNNQGSGQQQAGYQQQVGYQQQTPLPTPEEFINDRIDIYLIFTEAIKARGLDPADFAFGLGGWVTSFAMTRKGEKRKVIDEKFNNRIHNSTY